MPYLKILAIVISIQFLSHNATCQIINTDSLIIIAKNEGNTIKKVNLLLQISSGRNIDANLVVLNEALAISEKIQYTQGRINAMLQLSFFYRTISNFEKAVDLGLKSIRLAEASKDTLSMFDCYQALWLAYYNLHDANQVFEVIRKKQILIESGFLERNNLERQQYATANEFARAFTMVGKMDSARHYRYIAIKNSRNIDGITLYGLGDTYVNDNPDSAIFYYKKAIPILYQYNRLDIVGNVFYGLSRVFDARKMKDSALYYARKALPLSMDTIASCMLLHQLFAEQKNTDSAYKYLLKASLLKDDLFGIEKIKAIQLLNIKEQNRKEKEAQESIEREKQAANKLKMYGLLFVIIAISSFAILLIRINKQKGKANHLLQKQKEEIHLQKDNAEKAFAELRATQAQLIQSEKMASLGELTAGIAHEIQNPLNFVNNFSEVSNELIDEMKTEFKKGETEEGFAIADDIKQNLEKILHHGKRADAIVKGMLQHSQSSSGIKEPTDINALADEYLRLAYHGLRAKDNSFNATMITDFDESIGNVNIIPQDIGRVILNLITNAFYAAPLPPKEGFSEPNYLHNPTIWVSTKRIVTPSGNGGVLISVRDNGPGIPPKILDKIFQPFFTTKPTGQGTGLGLSLSYDIVKAHGGELKVETKEGEGAEFIIQLPVV